MNCFQCAAHIKHFVYFLHILGIEGLEIKRFQRFAIPKHEAHVFHLFRVEIFPTRDILQGAAIAKPTMGGCRAVVLERCIEHDRSSPCIISFRELLPKPGICLGIGFP